MYYKIEIYSIIRDNQRMFIDDSKSKSYRMLCNVYEKIRDSRLMYRVEILDVIGLC